MGIEVNRYGGEQLFVKASRRGIIDQFIELWVAVKGKPSTWIMVDATMEKLDEFSDPGPAPIQMVQSEAQVLMDSLWDCGIRPTEGAGSAGAMAATQRHLEDMRTLVFKKLPLLEVPNATR